MSIKQKDINLLIPLQQKVSTELTVAQTKKKGNALLILFPMLTAIAFLGGFAYLFISAMMEQSKITTVEVYLTSPETVSKYMQAQTEQERLDMYRSYYSSLAGYQEAIESYPTLDKAVFDAVELAAGGVVSVNSYNYRGDEAILVMHAQTAVVGNCPVMIERLKATGYFSSVSYYGYGSNTESYTFEITCVLNNQNSAE